MFTKIAALYREDKTIFIALSVAIIFCISTIVVLLVTRPANDPAVSTPKGDLLSVTVISDGMEVRVIRLADESEVACMVTTNGNNRPNSVDCDWK